MNRGKGDGVGKVVEHVRRTIREGEKRGKEQNKTQGPKLGWARRARHGRNRWKPG